MTQRTATSAAGMALRIVGGIGVGVGIATSATPVVGIGAVVAMFGHVLYRRGKSS